MLRFNENHVRTAINKIGGPTKTSNLLNISNGAVHAWIRAGRISNIDYARKVAELSGMPVEKVRPV
jgi:hypothetical protein